MKRFISQYKEDLLYADFSTIKDLRKEVNDVVSIIGNKTLDKISPLSNSLNSIFKNNRKVYQGDLLPSQTLKINGSSMYGTEDLFICIMQKT